MNPAFPTAPPCRMPCPHADYVKTVRWLIERSRFAEAKRIVECNSEENHPTPHDWNADLTMAERTKLNAVETAETIF